MFSREPSDETSTAPTNSTQNADPSHYDCESCAKYTAVDRSNAFWITVTICVSIVFVVVVSAASETPIVGYLLKEAVEILKKTHDALEVLKRACDVK
jgi:hypothetical protein